MSKIYNIPDFLNYLHSQAPKSDVTHVIHYDEEPTIRLESKPVTINFYFLAIKQTIDLLPPDENISDFYVFLDAPTNQLAWNLSKPLSGYAILVSAELLDKYAREYSFIKYANHEALFLMPDEKVTLMDLFSKALTEYRKEAFSQSVLVAYASLILSYIQLYYERQFSSRSAMYSKVVADFQQQLADLFRESTRLKELPTVAYFAGKANLSTNYFGDLIKYFTGHPPQVHIHQAIIQEAKRKLRQSDLTISEVAYSLGFEYPTYFTRFFRKETGLTPTGFRNQ